MRSSFIFCFILSAGLSATLLFSSQSCGESWVVNAAGELTRDGKAVPWSEAPEEVARLRGELQPEDKVHRSTITTGIPYVEFVKISRVEVVVERKTGERLVFHRGRIRYWFAVAGIALLPLGVWGLVALLAAPWNARPTAEDEEARPRDAPYAHSLAGGTGGEPGRSGLPGGGAASPKSARSTSAE